MFLIFKILGVNTKHCDASSIWHLLLPQTGDFFYGFDRGKEGSCRNSLYVYQVYEILDQLSVSFRPPDEYSGHCTISDPCCKGELLEVTPSLGLVTRELALEVLEPFPKLGFLQLGNLLFFNSLLGL